VTAKKKNTRDVSSPVGLQIIGTPIGNLEDITLRALRILREADLIAAEDTRRTRKLLSHYDIHTPLISYNEHNKEQVTPRLIKKLKSGNVVALVSDAGMPGISDPGHDLIKMALAEAIPISIVPGPSSITSALVLSGLSTKAFRFEGFLPRKKGQRLQKLEALLASEATSVLFESPNRLMTLLETIARLAPERRIAVARELTKKFEEVVRTTASEAAAHFSEKAPRGEFVVVLEGATERFEPAPPPPSLAAVDLVEDLMKKEGFTKKDAMRQAAQRLNISRRQVYRQLLEKDSKERQGP
jgi:16S rRNA (cytidine1402-2'-O)-methyltransferase